MRINEKRQIDLSHSVTFAFIAACDSHTQMIQRLGWEVSIIGSKVNSHLCVQTNADTLTGPNCPAFHLEIDYVRWSTTGSRLTNHNEMNENEQRDKSGLAGKISFQCILWGRTWTSIHSWLRRYLLDVYYKCKYFCSSNETPMCRLYKIWGLSETKYWSFQNANGRSVLNRRKLLQYVDWQIAKCWSHYSITILSMHLAPTCVQSTAQSIFLRLGMINAIRNYLYSNGNGNRSREKLKPPSTTLL